MINGAFLSRPNKVSSLIVDADLAMGAYNISAAGVTTDNIQVDTISEKTAGVGITLSNAIDAVITRRGLYTMADGTVTRKTITHDRNYPYSEISPAAEAWLSVTEYDYTLPDLAPYVASGGKFSIFVDWEGQGSVNRGNLGVYVYRNGIQVAAYVTGEGVRQRAWSSTTDLDYTAGDIFTVKLFLRGNASTCPDNYVRIYQMLYKSAAYVISDIEPTW